VGGPIISFILFAFLARTNEYHDRKRILEVERCLLYDVFQLVVEF
jgi:hypothetical protein